MLVLVLVLGLVLVLVALVRALADFVPHAHALPPAELDELHDLLASAVAEYTAHFDIGD